jgi:hypothetical protein
MGSHHGKHHAGYTNKLNAAIEGSDLVGLFGCGGGRLRFGLGWRQTEARSARPQRRLLQRH